jgi:hypothetical protein
MHQLETSRPEISADRMRKCRIKMTARPAIVQAAYSYGVGLFIVGFMARALLTAQEKGVDDQ